MACVLLLMMVFDNCRGRRISLPLSPSRVAWVGSEGRSSGRVAWLQTRPDQSIKESFNQSINQSINQLVNKSTNRSLNQTIDQPIDRSINQSTNQSTNRPTNQPTNLSLRLLLFVLPFLWLLLIFLQCSNGQAPQGAVVLTKPWPSRDQ